VRLRRHHVPRHVFGGAGNTAPSEKMTLVASAWGLQANMGSFWFPDVQVRGLQISIGIPGHSSRHKCNKINGS
jgi:hypothetical protein